MASSTFTHCSVASREASSEPMVGSAWSLDRLILIELPLPWPKLWTDAKGVHPGLVETLQQLWELTPRSSVLLIAPDKDIPSDGVRLIDLNFIDGLLTNREIICDSADVAATLLAEAKGEPLPTSARVDTTPHRNFVICTHGSRDACCATFGFPLYRAMKELTADDENTRVWRGSHFGGHRFAPTMIDGADGRYWGYVDADVAAAIYHRSGEAADLRDNYRGWMGHQAEEVQILEGEAFAREGWSWTTYRQTGSVIARDDDGERTEVELTGIAPDGHAVTYRGTVVLGDEYTVYGSCNYPPDTLRQQRLIDVVRIEH